MSQEYSETERQWTFDASLLSIEEVKRLARALGSERRERINRRKQVDSDVLCRLLARAVIRRVNELPPAEATEYVRELARDSEDKHVRGLAALVVPEVAEYDYELARDTITEVFLARNEEAIDAILDARRRLEETLPPERRADFIAHFDQRRDEIYPGLRRE